MNKENYLYLATDGINDFKKFGITQNIKARILKYNSTEHLRPIYFEKVFVFKSDIEARNAETKLKKEMKDYIVQTQHAETFLWNKVTQKKFNDLTKNYKLFEFSTKYVGNVKNDKFEYYDELLKTIKYGTDNGISNKKMEDLIISYKVGYYRENASPRVVMENRIKHLIKLTDKELCWDNKPRIFERMERLYNFEKEIKRLVELVMN